MFPENFKALSEKQSAPPKKQYYFLLEHLKFLEKMRFIHTLWVKSGKPLMKQLKSGHYTFRKYYKQGDQRKYFKKEWLLQMHFGLIVENQNKKTRIKTLNILKLLHTGCSKTEAVSLLFSRSI